MDCTASTEENQQQKTVQTQNTVVPAKSHSFLEPLAPTRARSRSICLSIKSIKVKDDNVLLSDLSKLGSKALEGVTATNIVNGSWTREEDEKVIEWVKQHGPTSWTKLAETIPGRIGKQCRERWHNSLDPNLIKTTWTQEEDDLIIQKQKELGNKWAKIAELLPGRTDNAVKNRWNSALKRRLAQQNLGVTIPKPRSPQSSPQSSAPSHSPIQPSSPVYVSAITLEKSNPLPSSNQEGQNGKKISKPETTKLPTDELVPTLTFIPDFEIPTILNIPCTDYSSVDDIDCGFCDFLEIGFPLD